MEHVLTAEQRMIVKQVREFMVKAVAPVAHQIDTEDCFPEGIWTALGDLGILGLGIPEQYGGSGMDAFTFALVVEQTARVCPALTLSYAAHTNLCAHNLERNANEEQKRKYLPGLCSGELIGCLGLTEPGAGSDAVGITTTAERDGDHFIINGSKMFITNAPIADVALVYTKTDMAKRARGITAFLIEKGAPGFSVSPRIEKMGHHGSPTGELVFNDCRVHESCVVGEVDHGIHVMMTGLDIERVCIAAMALGMAEAALEQGLKYARTRHQFDQPISNFQLIKAKLADMYTEIEAARGLVYRAAQLADRCDRGGKGTELHRLAGAAVLFAAETASRAANQSLQIHGGYGYTLEYPINRFFRDAKLLEIGAGTSEIRRILIANELIEKGLGYV
ncbi:MAG: acyl-CoA dehydrogenase family protein [Desulfatibacillaceae bacterium]